MYAVTSAEGTRLCFRSGLSVCLCVKYLKILRTDFDKIFGEVAGVAQRIIGYILVLFLGGGTRTTKRCLVIKV